MKIYTKTGDDGTTGLLGGARIAKNSDRIEAIGDVDELNAHLGVCRLHAHGLELDTTLEQIQSSLFELGSELASPPGGRIAYAPRYPVEMLERSIDAQVERLAPLRNFILPGGSPLAAHLHLARAVCRRAERSVLALEGVSPAAIAFLNRLSDWLFTAARTANAEAGVLDIAWHSREVS